MSRDSDLLDKYDLYDRYFTSNLEILSVLINEKYRSIYHDASAITSIDLNKLKSVFGEMFEYLSVVSRFLMLRKLSNYKLELNDHAEFIIKDHVFENLDEVEKALNNKVFL